MKTRALVAASLALVVLPALAVIAGAATAPGASARRTMAGAADPDAILVAQVEEDGAAARRRRRPSFVRPGGGRGPDAGKPAEQTPPPQPAPDGTTAPESQASPSTAPGTTPVAPAGDATGPATVPTDAGAPVGRPVRQDAPVYENELPNYELAPVPDRWRIIENLGVHEKWYDPYNQNTLKADRPLPGTEDWFLNLSVIYDAIVEARRIPTPTGAAGDQSGELDLFGDGSQFVTAHTLIGSISLLQGDTTFRPPDWEFRLTAAANVNVAQINQLGALRVDPRENDQRVDTFVAIQEAFVDKHLWNRSERYDFDSVRIGIQPFNADFRGFLFASQEPGVRFFGNFFNNRAQYNVAWFRRLNKDTNSALNNIQSLRDDDTVIANFYYQDFPVLGLNIEALFAANINREANRRDFDDNSNIVIPSPVGLGRGHDYEVYYIGLAGDGHIDRLNLSFQLYGALGHDDFNSIAQSTQDIQSFFTAIEASYDVDWMRFKAFMLYAMGDEDPFDGKATGFDTILDNPNFAGGTTSFWQRQQIPFVFGGGVALSGVNSIVPSLRSSKTEGQSNFVNPGLWQAGFGADFDVLPELKLISNVSYLAWDSVEVLEILRQQERISRDIGWDVSAGLIYRPFFTNNVIFRASGAVLLPGSGYEELFDDRTDEPPYSVLLNLTLTY